MNSVFIDTDVSLDLLAQREPHYAFAAQLFTLADEKKVKIYISSLSLSNLNYILKRGGVGGNNVRKALINFKLLVNVLPVDDRVIQQALNSGFGDLEDAIQHYTAMENHLTIILTRNIKDYKKSTITVSTPEQFLKTV